MLRFRIVEKLLFEDIDAVRKYYPNIDDNTFLQLISLDPTYKDGKDSLGNYGKWILNLYKNKKLKEEDFYKVTELLQKFDKNKRDLQNKDIFQFKSLPDLYSALENIDTSHLTGRQIERRKRTAYDEAEKLYEDADWEVWTPETYSASCTLGKGTSWCTAHSKNDYYYNYYTKQGPLYVVINKHNPDEKYQFHFPSRQFMNSADEPIGRWFFTQDNTSKLWDFFSDEVEENECDDDFSPLGELYGVRPLDDWLVEKIITPTVDDPYDDAPYCMSYAVTGNLDSINYDEYVSALIVNRDNYNYVISEKLSKLGDKLTVDGNNIFYEINFDGSLTQIDESDLDDESIRYLVEALNDVIQYVRKNVWRAYTIPIIELEDYADGLCGLILFNKPVDDILTVCKDILYRTDYDVFDLDKFFNYIKNNIIPEITESDILEEVSNYINSNVTYVDTNGNIIELGDSVYDLDQEAKLDASHALYYFTNRLVQEHFYKDITYNDVVPEEIGLEEVDSLPF